MQIKDLTSLKINTLTQAQYDAAKAAGTLSEEELYLTPSTESSSADWANITNKPALVANLESENGLAWSSSADPNTIIASIQFFETSNAKVVDIPPNFIKIASSGDVVINSGGVTNIRNVKDPTANTDAANKKYVDDEIKANKTVVDLSLSNTSTNPVQNKVVKAAIDAIPTGPTITYGTTDLVAGTSELAEGTFYFVYE